MTAQEMASTYGVSLRTARRHLAAGTEPDARRKVGRDGKTYAGSANSYKRSFAVSRASDDCIMARNAVRRIARVDRFTLADLAYVEEIAAIVTETARTMRATVAADKRPHL